MEIDSMMMASDVSVSPASNVPFLCWLFVFSLISVLTAVHFYFKSRESFKLAMQIPGPDPLPLLGNAHLAVGKSSHEIMNRALELADIYGHTARGFLGYKVLVFLNDPRDIELILNSNVHLTKSAEYRFFVPWLGDGLLLSNGDKWRSHRKMIAPAFHQYVLKSFFEAFNRNSWHVVDRLKTQKGQEFDVHDYMSEVTVDILLETAMGHPKTHDDREGFDYAMAVMKMCEIIQKRYLTFFLRPDMLFNIAPIKREHDRLLNIIHSLTGKVFRSKKEQMRRKIERGERPKMIYPDLVMKNEKDAKEKKLKNENATNNNTPTEAKIVDDTEEPLVGEKNRLAFLDLMIESTFCGTNITDEEIKEEVDTIMFEGHDTTAACASFALCLLACHPEIQERVVEEQRMIFGDSDRHATFADVVQMHYLERVIFETLRMYPPVPVIAREVKENVRLASNPSLVIPANATVAVSTFRLHRRNDIYPNAEKFDPDNFLPERTQNRHYYSFIPFSAGPRSCVGRKYAMLKVKILLSTIVRNFRILSDCTEADFKLQGDIILKRTDGFRIRVEPR